MGLKRRIKDDWRFFWTDASWTDRVVAVLCFIGGPIAAVYLLVIMLGCSHRILPRPPIAAPPATTEISPDTIIEHSRVESANEEVARLRGDLKRAEARADNARAAEREARLAGVRRLVTWSTAIFALVGILSVGAFVFLRMTSLLLLSGACAAMIAAAQATNLLLDHPVVAGLSVAAVVAGVVGAILWKQRHTEHGLCAAITVAEALKPDPTEESANDREERRLMQSQLVDKAGAGAFDAIERARDKIAKKLRAV